MQTRGARPSSRSKTPVAASRSEIARACSAPSTRRPKEEPAWGFRRCGASRASTAGASKSARSRGAARPSECACPSTRVGEAPCRRHWWAQRRDQKSRAFSEEGKRKTVGWNPNSIRRRGAEDRGQRPQQRLRRVRLRQKLFYTESRGLLLLRVLREAAGRDDLHGGVKSLEGADGRQPVHEGHHHVGDDAGDLVLHRGIEGDCLGAVARAQHTIAECFQRALGDLPDRLLVVYNENQLPFSCR